LYKERKEKSNYRYRTNIKSVVVVVLLRTDVGLEYIYAISSDIWCNV